jgi:hypothetical protein
MSIVYRGDTAGGFGPRPLGGAARVKACEHDGAFILQIESRRKDAAFAASSLVTERNFLLEQDL